jgi:predicted metal-dependent hydrolase
MNHSRAFWAEVERLCPDYRRRRGELLATDHLYRSF